MLIGNQDIDMEWQVKPTVELNGFYNYAAVKLLSLPQASTHKLINPNPKVLQVSSQRTHITCLARAGTRQPVLVRAGTLHAC